MATGRIAGVVGTAQIADDQMVRAGLMLIVLIALGSRSRAMAQTCHPLALRSAAPASEPYRVTVGLLAASYGSGDQAGDYQGLFAGFGYQGAWLGAELLLPSYRLSQSSGESYGLGDLVLTGRATLLRARSDAITAGVELPAMLPTGELEEQLGMGRVMLMPGAWFSFARAPFSLRAQVGYGRMLGAEMRAPHHHGASERAMQHPIVNPMNRSELEHALTLGLGLSRAYSVHARWFGAVPIDDRHGVVRQILAGGATASMGAVDLSLELQRPVAGDPFDYKLVLQLGVGF